MKKCKKLLTLFLCFALIITSVVVLAGCALNPDTEIQTFNVAGDLKVGIISDSQLPPKQKDDNGVFKQNLINSLQGLKANNVNMIIFAGDIGDKASNYAYDTYNECYRTVFGLLFKILWAITTIGVRLTECSQRQAIANALKRNLDKVHSHIMLLVAIILLVHRLSKVRQWIINTKQWVNGWIIK